MKRKVFVALGLLAGLASAGLGFAAASAEPSDRCYDESSDIGVPGPVGVGYDSDTSNVYNADQQFVCYRVYNPVNGTKVAGGVVHPYQYRFPFGSTWQSGGVQCASDPSAQVQTPGCYVVYGVGAGVFVPDSVAVGLYAGQEPTIVESYGTGLHDVVVPSVNSDADTVTVSATSPRVCAIATRPVPVGGCTSPVGATVSVETDDVTLYNNPAVLGLPTGVKANNDPGTPLVSGNVAGLPVSQDLPGNCIGIC